MERFLRMYVTPNNNVKKRLYWKQMSNPKVAVTGATAKAHFRLAKNTIRRTVF